MALAQNLLEFTSDYGFCGINRVFAYQNRAKLRLKGQIFAKSAPSKQKDRTIAAMMVGSIGKRVSRL